MEDQSLNAQISYWMRVSVAYQIAIGLSITVLVAIVLLWIVFEIIHIKRRKELSIERQKHQMDGVKIVKTNEINNNKNNVIDKSMDKPLLQRVVINNMNKNYQLSQNYIKMNSFKQNEHRISTIEEGSDAESETTVHKSSIEE